MDSLTKELSTIEKSLASTPSRIPSQLRGPETILTDPNICKLCNYKAKNAKGLNIHTKKAHGTLDSNKNEAISQGMDDNKNEANLCLGCNKAFTTKSGLTRHTKTCQPDALNQNEFKCSTCDSSYSYKKNLTRHMKTCGKK